MSFLKKTFFHKVYRYNKTLFFFLLLFALLTSVTNAIGDEITPFFVFGMYSAKEQKEKSYEILEIVVNDTINVAEYSLSAYQKHFVIDPLRYYKLIKYNANIDPTITFLRMKLGGHYKFISPFEAILFNGPKEMQEFMPWYSKYLEQVLDRPVNSITICIRYVHFTQDQRVVLDSTHSFEKWSK